HPEFALLAPLPPSSRSRLRRGFFSPIIPSPVEVSSPECTRTGHPWTADPGPLPLGAGRAPEGGDDRTAGGGLRRPVPFLPHANQTDPRPHDVKDMIAEGRKFVALFVIGVPRALSPFPSTPRKSRGCRLPSCWAGRRGRSRRNRSLRDLGAGNTGCDAARLPR